MSATSAAATTVLRRVCWQGLKKVGLTPKRISHLTGTSRLQSTDLETLQQMRRDNSAAPDPYRATAIWDGLARQFEDWFCWEGIGEVEEQAMNGMFSSPRAGNPKLLRYACWLLYQNLKVRDKLDLLSRIPASVRASSGYAFEFEGRNISWDLLISLDSLYSIAEVSPEILSEPVVVADIGAGWGRMGYVLKMANPKASYLVFDLPETLLVCSRYLPTRLPNERIMGYSESRGMSTLTKALLREWGCVFLGAQDFERLEDKSLDFVINIASFQEMTAEQVDLYFDAIDRKLSGMFYTLQLWNTATQAYDVGEVSGYQEFPFRPHWKSHYTRHASWSDLYFETILSVP